MLKIGLLTSTAMTAIALLLSGAPGMAQPQTDMHVASRDPNARFLCTYGHFLVSAYSYSQFYHSSSFASGWTHVAVPVTGHGQSVHRIRVIESQPSHSVSAFVSAGIYSNGPSGFPGKLIAGGKGKVGLACGPVTISIPRTRLKPHTTYWIEETAHVFPSFPTSRYWEIDPDTKRRAYVQIHHYRVCSSSCSNISSTTPWTEQAKGPYLKLK